MTRRPRGTAEQAVGDIKAAMARLVRGRPQRASAALTATNLADEAGMSRKQLYHYFDQEPALVAAWRNVVADRDMSKPTAGAAAELGRVRELEQQLDIWKMLAAVARADAEREAEVNAALRNENTRLRPTTPRAGGEVVHLRAVEDVT